LGLRSGRVCGDGTEPVKKVALWLKERHFFVWMRREF
jgi:hypothetical protein